MLRDKTCREIKQSDRPRRMAAGNFAARNGNTYFLEITSRQFNARTQNSFGRRCFVARFSRGGGVVAADLPLPESCRPA